MPPRSKPRPTAAAAPVTNLFTPARIAAAAPPAAERVSGTLGGSPVGPREVAAGGELGGHPGGAVPPSSSLQQHPHQPNNAMSEKTTKTTESANVPGHDKKVETHTEETRHQPETKVETKTESKEAKPE